MQPDPGTHGAWPGAEGHPDGPPGDMLAAASTGLHLFCGWRKETCPCLPKLMVSEEEWQRDVGGARHIGRATVGAQCRTVHPEPAPRQPSLTTWTHPPWLRGCADKTSKVYRNTQPHTESIPDFHVKKTYPGKPSIAQNGRTEKEGQCWIKSVSEILAMLQLFPRLSASGSRPTAATRHFHVKQRGRCPLPASHCDTKSN